MSPTTKLRIRASLFVTIATIMVGGPTWVQLFGGPSGPWTRPWRMYSRVGLEVCVVRYESPEGEPLDRIELLGLDRDKVRRKNLLLKRRIDVREEANRICRRQRKQDPRFNLRATVDCTRGREFKTVIKPQVALCR